MSSVSEIKINPIGKKKRSLDNYDVADVSADLK